MLLCCPIISWIGQLWKIGVDFKDLTIEMTFTVTDSVDHIIKDGNVLMPPLPNDFALRFVDRSLHDGLYHRNGYNGKPRPLQAGFPVEAQVMA
ncbi:hypothetical protein CMI47_10125 [Candidatus Pacearchaeota archaeon]|nr:hypothetical protein [Candidatus Pacearchaeota archaeon]